jgi:phosphoglycerate dehydrogenase-like enzyme
MPSLLMWLDAPGDYLRAAEAAGLAASVELVTTPLKSDPPDDLLARADALLAWRPPARLAARAPRLRWIQSLTGGCEQWLGADTPAGAVLTCARGTHRVQMSEHILAGLFLCAKDLAAIVLDQVAGRWRRRVNPTLAGATLGILGLGAIGVEVARWASALGMRVIGTKREPAPLPGVERVYPPAETDRVLGESDYLLLLLPSTADTRGIIDKRALGRMKPGAFVLNFGRGDLVVDDDLVAAVRERRIAGAVLDVYRTEPLPAGHPFWTTPGIVVLPHVGGLHPRRDAIVADLWVENLGRFLAGRPLLQVVDRARGY